MTDDSASDEEIRCYHCGNPNIVASTPVVPIEELEQLADEWDKNAENLEHGFAAGLLKHKAMELEDLIDEYGDGDE